MTLVSPQPSPVVSALMTTFNHEQFISVAIEGLLAQTYSKVEIIVVDDGSSDATVDLVRSYQHEGVRLFQTRREGPSRAMNFAMSHAAGEIFLIQSGDDFSEPTRAERQVATLQKVDLVACWPQLIDDDGKRLEDDRAQVFFRMASPLTQKSLFRSLYVDNNFLCASSVSMRRSVWQTLGGFHPGLLQLQDFDYWLRALAAGFSFAIEQDRLVSYRLHTQNLSDVRNNVRTQRELATLLRYLSPRLPDHLMAAVLYKDSLEEKDWSDAERGMLRALFFLCHPSDYVRQIGVDHLIALMNSDYDQQARSSFGLSRQALFQALLYN